MQSPFSTIRIAAAISFLWGVALVACGDASGVDTDQVERTASANSWGASEDGDADEAHAPCSEMDEAACAARSDCSVERVCTRAYPEPGCRSFCVPVPKKVDPFDMPCEVDGQSYAVNETFAAPGDGCGRCTCKPGGTIACQRIGCDDPPGDTCKSGGKTYALHEEFRAPDGCNRCRCLHGGIVACSRIDCEAEPLPCNKLGAEACERRPDCEFDRLVHGHTGNNATQSDGVCRPRQINDDPPQTTLLCEFGGQLYEVGQSFPGPDCNSCTCASGGEIACTQSACPHEPKDAPAPVPPNQPACEGLSGVHCLVEPSCLLRPINCTTGIPPSCSWRCEVRPTTKKAGFR